MVHGTRLPQVFVENIGMMTVDFRCQEIRYILPGGELEIFSFGLIESQIFLAVFFAHREGKKEVIRYRDECIRNGWSVDHLAPYEHLIDEAEEK